LAILRLYSGRRDDDTGSVSVIDVTLKGIALTTLDGKPPR
jgi:hypothetical protein